MARNVIIGLLIAGVLLAGGFAFFQTQNLTQLQGTSTQEASNLREAGTQLADEAIATGTQLADESFATATEAANLAATATQSADNAIATGTSLADSAMATQTQAVDFARATGTQLADESFAAATEAANLAATEAALGTDTAAHLATQQIEQTVAAIVFADSQATSDAQNAESLSTLVALDLTGGGLSGESAEVPAGFRLFEGDGYEILLADGFVGGDFVSGSLARLEDEMGDVGLEDTFEQLSTDGDDFLFFAIDTTLVRGVSRATVSLIREDALTEGVTLPEYISNAVFSLQGDFALIVSDIIPVNGQVAGRIIIDQQFSDAAVRQVQYIFAVDNQFYVLTFTTPVVEYANIREALEISANSLRLRD